MIDLHVHSTASDGTISPAALVDDAVQRRLTAIALTDHDTVAGLPEFLAAAAAAPIQGITGVEIGCSWYGSSMHLLGLFIDPNDVALNQLLEMIRAGRQLRNGRILANLTQMGLPITAEIVQQYAGGEVVGRPHMAQALVAAGVCRDNRDAFARYLGRESPGYVRRWLPLPKDAIHAVHGAGGVAIWAHPLGMREVAPAKLRQTARILQSVKLDGMETRYSEYDAAAEKMADAVSSELGLLPSGGSDYHGANVVGVELGSGRGTLQIPDGFLPALQQRAQFYQSQRQ